MVQGLEGGPSAQQLSLPEPAARWSRVNQLSQISGLPPPPRGEGRGRGRQSTWPPGDLEASGVTCEERSRPQATGKEHSHRPLSERSPAPREPPPPPATSRPGQALLSVLVGGGRPLVLVTQAQHSPWPAAGSLRLLRQPRRPGQPSTVRRGLFVLWKLGWQRSQKKTPFLSSERRSGFSQVGGRRAVGE